MFCKSSEKTFAVSAVDALAGLFLGFVCLLLAGCNDPASKPLRIGTNAWPGYETLYLAREIKLLQEDRVRLFELPNATEVSFALRNGLLDGAGLSLDEAVTLIQQKLDISVLLVMDFSTGGDVLLAKPHINDLQALKGARIGVENTALGALMLDAVLRKADLRLDQVQLVRLTVDEQESAYHRDSIDALVTFDPITSRLMADQESRVLFSSKEIPGRIIDVLVLRNDLDPAKREHISHLVESHFKAQKYLAEQPDSAATIIAPRLDIPAGKVLRAFEGLTLPDREENRRFLTGAPAQIKLRAEELARLMLENSLITAYPQIDQLSHPYWLGGD